MYRFKVAGNLSNLASISLKETPGTGRERGEEPVRRWGGGPIAARAKRRRDGGGCSLDVARVLPRDPDPNDTQSRLHPLPRHQPILQGTKPHFIPLPHLKSSPNHRVWTKLGKRAGFFGDWLWKKLWTAFHPQAPQVCPESYQLNYRFVIPNSHLAKSGFKQNSHR